MKTYKLSGKVLALAVAGVMLASLLLLCGGATAGPLLAQEPTSIEGVADVAPVLNYQGRLLDPATGNPKPNGNYQMIFSIYGVDAGGTALWSETKSVAVTDGLFSTLLGDTNPLTGGIFDGRQLWLGVTVGADPEATPRQRIAHSVYALHAQHANQASELGGQPASAFAPAVHQHSGADITSGTVADARIASTIARDSEIMPMVLGNDGAGSGLDADLLDGQHAAAFAPFSHNHNDLYFTKSESDARFVNASGDTMSGVLTVPRIAYSTPRTQYFTIGGEGFVPGSNVDYVNTYGNGGAYIASGTGALVAPVHLPQGAVVTAFKVFFYDASSSDMSVEWARQNMAGGGYAFLAEVTSTGISGYGNKTTTSISGNPIDNTNYSYHVYAYSSAWDSNLRIKGALITYTISEVP